MCLCIYVLYVICHILYMKNNKKTIPSVYSSRCLRAADDERYLSHNQKLYTLLGV